ncbi:MAG: hypothetical protein GX675_05970 [Erysipelotrichaceae bacterium]|nr:hypothetical protein [Erysipelotrichaceae bacterium]
MAFQFASKQEQDLLLNSELNVFDIYTLLFALKGSCSNYSIDEVKLKELVEFIKENNLNSTKITKVVNLLTTENLKVKDLINHI